MIPLRATFHYKVEVPVDYENPDHVEYHGLGVATENKICQGYITEILELKDSAPIKLLQGIKENDNGQRYSDYKESFASASGVYVVFWEDRGDDYRMHVEDYNSFTVSRKEMEEYVRNFVQLDMFEKEFDSKEEYWFSCYLGELKEHGWLVDYKYQPQSFVLSEDHYVHAFEHKKDCNKPIQIKLMRGAEYTADFKLIWSKNARNVFFWGDGNVGKVGFYPFRKAKAGSHVPFYAVTGVDEIVSYIDVKGGV